MDDHHSDVNGSPAGVLAVGVETGTGVLRLDLPRRLVAEALGTCLLVIAVIGSGIMAQRMSPGDVGLQLLENAAATAGALVGLILMFAAVSGAHFNPVVTLLDRLFATITTTTAVVYIAAQLIGGCTGALLANVMFDLPAFELATTRRSSGGLWLSEVIATVGLLLVIHGCVRTGRANAVAVRGRRVDRRCLLVHLVDQLRQPRRHRRPDPLGQLRRDRPRLGTDVHRHAADRHGCRVRADPLLYPRTLAEATNA